MHRRFFLAFIVTVGLLIAGKAYGFTISPLRYVITLDPGKNETLNVEIKNDEKQSMNFYLKILGVRQDSQGRPMFDSGIDSAESWVHPEPDFVFLGPGEERAVNFVVAAPKQAAPGLHYLGLAVEAMPAEAKEVGIGGRLITLLSLYVSGTVEEKLLLGKWSDVSGKVWNKEKRFSAELKNKGNIDLPLSGEIKVRNWIGRELFRKPAELGNNILPQSVRQVERDVIFEDAKWPGIYKVELDVGYGILGHNVSAFVYVWYLPIWSIVIAIIICILIIALIVIREKVKKEY